jgi:DNA repair exonuclease SbcCD nuclease subunit
MLVHVIAGDFWDRRGDLPVVPLNKVQQELSGWQVPLLLLPGNHDQVQFTARWDYLWYQ